jgi:hypothetical protein
MLGMGSPPLYVAGGKDTTLLTAGAAVGEVDVGCRGWASLSGAERGDAGASEVACLVSAASTSRMPAVRM